MIRGEWWIHNGDITYCDGDYCECNHEQVVVNHALVMLADILGVDGEDTYIGLTEALGFDDPATSADLLYELCAKHDCEELWQIVIDSSNIDSRAYAMREWGWHAVRGRDIETWEITDAAMDEIIRGIWRILEYDCDELEPDDVIHVSGTRGRRYLTLTGAQIEAGEIPTDPSAFEPFFTPGGPNAAVAALDYNSQHPYYRS